MPGNGLGSDLATGALAGVAATWVMHRLTSRLYAFESEPVRRREEASGGGRTAYENALDRAARAPGLSLSERIL